MKPIENLNISHQTSKDDDDPIMEYRNIKVDHLEFEKINLGGVKFFNADSQELITLSMKKVEDGRKNNTGLQHILPLDPYRYFTLRRSKKRAHILEKSFINLPVASGMGWMSRKLKRPLKQLVPTIHLTLGLIRLAQALDYTIFIVGSKDSTLEKLFFNLMRSFPKLRIVGRHTGYFNEHSKSRVVEALKKTDPHIIILGLGFQKEIDWITEHRDQLGNAILINVGGALDIMAGKGKRAPDAIQLHGLTWLWRACNRPHRWYRLLIITLWVMQVYYWRLFKKNK